MGIRWTEEEAKDFGYVKDGNGNWFSPHQWSQAKSALKKEKAPASPSPSNVPRPAAESECIVNGKDERQVKRNRHCKTGNNKSKIHSQKFIVRVVMYYFRTMDPDNWIYKWYLDDLVHKGFLPGDSTDYIAKIVEQHIRVDSEDKQKTIIEVYIKQ